MTVIIPEFKLLEIIRKPPRRDSMMFDKSFFGPTPESFETVDIYFATGESFLMIDGKVAIPAKHERIVDRVSVGVDNAATANDFYREPEQGIGADIGDNFHLDGSLTLQDTEHGYFPGSAATSPAFPFAAEIALVDLNLAAEQFVGIGGSTENRMADYHHCPVNRIIGHGKLRGNLVCRYLQLEQFENTKPVLATQPGLVQPSSGEVRESISTSRTATSITGKFPQFSTSALGTNTLMVFEAFSQQVSGGTLFALNN